MAVTIGDLRCAGEFGNGEIMTDGKGKLTDDEASVRSYKTSANKVIVLVSEKFEETMVLIKDGGGRDFVEMDDDLFVFTVTF